MREHHGRGPIKAKTYVLDNLTESRPLTNLYRAGLSGQSSGWQHIAERRPESASAGAADR